MTPRRPRSTPTLIAAKIILLLGGGLLAVLMVGTTAYSTAGVLVRTSERADDVVEGRFERVHVHVSGRLDVRPGAEGRARIVRESDFSFERPQVTQHIVDGVLELRYGCRGLTVVCDHHVTLTLPPDVALDIDADHVVVSDMSGPIQANSGGGAIELQGVSGPIDARVGGGAVIGTDLRSSDVRADTGGGSVEMAFSRPPDWVDVSAGAGHVEVVLPPGEEAYRVQADSGVGAAQISVRQDPLSERVIRATAGAGDVSVRYGPS